MECANDEESRENTNALKESVSPGGRARHSRPSPSALSGAKMSRTSLSSLPCGSGRRSANTGGYLKTTIYEEEDAKQANVMINGSRKKSVTPPKMLTLEKMCNVMQRTARYTSKVPNNVSTDTTKTVIPRKKHRNRQAVNGLYSNGEESLGNRNDFQRFSADFDKEFDEKYSAEDEEFHNPTIKFYKKYDDLSQNVYIAACRELGETPASYFLRNLTSKEIIMKNHVLGPSGTKACTVALVNNTKVERLNLQGNELGAEGAACVADMLRDNLFIRDLNLSENNLGTEGARMIASIMSNNDTITRLDISGNNFKENDAVYMAQILQGNSSLREFILSHNEFREKGGEILSPALAKNESVTLLDLSWNHLRRRGAKAVCDGLATNETLKELDLSWNGFHLDGCKAMGRCLSKNESLVSVNLACNRIDMECLKELLKGLKKNSTLHSLNLGRNPVSSEGALLILQTIQKNEDIAINSIDISGQAVDKDFITTLLHIQTKRLLHMEHGIILKQDETENVENQGLYIDDDPMIVLMEFMRIKNLRLVDLFKALDADGSGTLTREEFRLGLLSVNIPLSERGLNKLIDKLDADGDGEVDYSELIAGQKDHRRRVSRINMKAKQSNTPADQTVIARVSANIKAILALREAQKASAVAEVSQARRQSTALTSHAGERSNTQSKHGDTSSSGASLSTHMEESSTMSSQKNAVNLRAHSANLMSAVNRRQSFTRPQSANTLY